MLMAFVCVSLTACGGDDGDGGGGVSGGTGSGSVGGNGISFSYNRGYFYAQAGKNGKTDYIIMLYNCDYFTAIQRRDASMLPNELQSMTITFPAEGSTSAVPTGEFTPFEALTVSITKEQLLAGEEHGKQYGGGSSTATVKITKNGDTYTISFDEIDFVNVLNGNHSVVFSSGFTYTGTLAPVPEGYFSVK